LSTEAAAVLDAVLLADAGSLSLAAGVLSAVIVAAALGVAVLDAAYR
jgi:hypothetical protein